MVSRSQDIHHITLTLQALPSTFPYSDEENRSERPATSYKWMVLRTGRSYHGQSHSER